MFQILSDYIDQLDLALDQLALNDRNYDRFAFLLIDNVFELILHQYAVDCASENDLYMRGGEPKYGEKQVQKALGGYFRDKALFAMNNGLFESDTYNSVLKLHAYRNSAYHKGIRHENILHSMSLFYFEIVCDSLISYRPRFYSYSGSDKISYRAMKYIGTPNIFKSTEGFSNAFKNLKEIIMSFQDTLIIDLYNDLNLTVRSIDEQINFLSDDSPRPMTREEVILNCQAWQFAFSEAGSAFALKHDLSSLDLPEYVEWIKGNYKFKINGDPITQWNKVVESLKVEVNNHKALKKYCDFSAEINMIQDEICQAAIALDVHIQEQIDYMLGK